jgi:hypothetical protein
MEVCEDEEALQLHFEGHFAFNRVYPPHRYTCSTCGRSHDFQNAQCLCRGQIEHLIVGSFIRNQTYQRYAPDGQDVFGRSNSSSDPLSLFTMPNNNGVGPGMGNNGSNNGSMNQSEYYQNNNMFRGQGPSSGHQGGNFGSYDVTQQAGFQFHGSDSGEVTEMEVVPVQSWYTKPLQTLQRNKSAFLVTLLFAMTLIVEGHELLITKARAVRLHPDLPFVGFVTLVVSFVMCHIYWTLRDPYSQRDGRIQRVCQVQYLGSSHTCTYNSQRLAKCPLDISSSAISSLQRGPAAPSTLIRGRIYL